LFLRKLRRYGTKLKVCFRRLLKYTTKVEVCLRRSQKYTTKLKVRLRGLCKGTFNLRECLSRLRTYTSKRKVCLLGSQKYTTKLTVCLSELHKGTLKLRHHSLTVNRHRLVFAAPCPGKKRAPPDVGEAHSNVGESRKHGAARSGGRLLCLAPKNRLPGITPFLYSSFAIFFPRTSS